jgi:hypothetical protein
MSQHYALRLDIKFKYEFSWCEKDAIKIIDLLEAVSGEVKGGMYTEKTRCMIFVSKETPKQLIDRIKPILSELNSIDNYWCGECPSAFWAKDGAFDPAVVASQNARRKAEFLTETNNVEEPKPRKTRI